MKTKITYGILVFATILMTACVQAPSDVELKDYLAEIQLYYPYSIDEEFNFVNEETGQIWENRAYEDQTRTFPYSSINTYDNIEAGNNGHWDVTLQAFFTEKESNPIKEIKSSVGTLIWGESSFVTIEWQLYINMIADDMLFDGYARSTGTKNEISNLLKDTIDIVFAHKFTENKYVSVPEGSYARIVRNKGLTDFCIDGKTVWRRVK
jgi:hypothetical protein